jgi:hypothetical protein
VVICIDFDSRFMPQANSHGGIGQLLATGRKVGKTAMTSDTVTTGSTGRLGSTVMGLSGKLSCFEPDDDYFKYGAREWEARDKVSVRPTRAHAPKMLTGLDLISYPPNILRDPDYLMLI